MSACIKMFAHVIQKVAARQMKNEENMFYLTRPAVF